MQLTRRRVAIPLGMITAALLTIIPMNAFARQTPAGTDTHSPGQLADVDLLSDSDGWAVGGNANGSTSEAFVKHWNGSGWVRVAVPNPGKSYNYLSGVAAVSANDVWAVGSYDSRLYQSRALILHWDGSAWTQTPVPHPQYRHFALYSVGAISESDIWAVGGSSHSLTGSRRPLIMHWDGHSWIRIRNSHPLPPRAGLTAVGGTSPSDVWAVGDFTVRGLPRAWSAHWDGHLWTRVPLPNGHQDAVLNDVTVDSASSAWAVGTYWPDEDQPQPLAIHWDGSRWTQWATELPPGGQFSAVVSVSSSDAWAVGFSSGERDWVTMIEHFDGHSWSRIHTPARPCCAVLFGVDATAEDYATAVGFHAPGSDRYTLVEHWDGQRWGRQ